MSDRQVITDEEFDSIDWDAIFQEVEAARIAKKLRRDNPYVLDLIRVLRNRPQGMARKFVLHEVWKNRERKSLPVPPKFEEAVQQALERHCIDSDVFKELKVSEDEALFCWPRGKGKGFWAPRLPQINAWLFEFLRKRRAQISRTGI